MQKLAPNLLSQAAKPLFKTAELVHSTSFDNAQVRWFLLPFASVLWLACTFFAICMRSLVKLTVRIEIEGQEKVIPEVNYIYSCWHEHFYTAAVALFPIHGPAVLITNNHWMTVPLRMFARWLGVKKFVITSDKGSKAGAFTTCLEHLSNDHHILITPDGGGRPKEIRGQVIDMAAKSGVAILPVEFQAQGVWRLHWTWDKKVIPLPFAKIKMIYKQPIYVSPATAKDVQEKLSKQLGL